MVKKPLVTALVSTYNHAAFIRDTLDGILMQKTDFPFDCFIYDDASTDGTSDIIREYKNKYPDIIHAFIAQENTFTKPYHFDHVVSIQEKSVFGKYIALCEGDDYWIDKDKLQKQVSFMETHPSVSFSIHSSLRKNYLDGTEYEHVLYPEDCYVPMIDFFTLRDSAPDTASIVIRRDVYFSWTKDKTYPKAQVLDFPLMLYCLLNGECYYFTDVMSVYRYQTKGSKTDSVRGKAYASFSVDYERFFDDWNKYTDHKYRDYVRIFSNQQLITTVFRLCDELKDDTEARECISRLYDSHTDYTKYIDALAKMFEIIRDDEGISRDELRMIRNSKHIVVFGLGKYSEIVENILFRKGIVPEGYIVSEKKIDCRNDKTVWDFNDFPYEWDDVIVLAGVSYTWKNEIEPLFINRGMNYVAPLWTDLCEWL